MNAKTWIPLALAIVLGVVAAKVARDMLMQNRPTPAQGVKLSKVIVAKIDINPGHEIKPDDLSEAQVSADSVPAGSFSDIGALKERVAETRMVKGQTILEPQLAPQGAGSGLQALIPKGMRAITIEVNEFSGVAGLLQPGCRVDILATIQGDGKQLARTIVQNVVVTAVGQRLVPKNKEDQDPNAPPEITRSVTVLATLKETEAIELATATARARLVLRSARDEEVSKSQGITMADLSGTKEEGFWAGAAQFMSQMKATTQPSAGQGAFASAQGRATTQPAEPKYIVRVFRAGAESKVGLDIDKKSTVEAATDQREISR